MNLLEGIKEDAARMFRLNEMSKLEFVNKMNDIQNKKNPHCRNNPKLNREKLRRNRVKIGTRNTHI
jgi:hypothetical protein